MHNHIVNHIKNPTLVSDSTLYVVGVVSNPVRFHSRYRLAREWIEAMAKTPHVHLTVVEAAYGDRHHEITTGLDCDVLQLRTEHELWHKENMVNLGMRQVLGKHPRAKYLAWVDMDVFWHDPNWALETIHQLQHHPVVQPWKDCIELNAQGGILLNEKLQPLVHTSFCFVHRLKVPKQTHPTQPYKYAHSGFAWACTRSFWENVGGLMDWCIVGSADHHQAFGMVNHVDWSVHGQMSDGFKRKAKEWEARAWRACRGNLGFVNTRIEHKFHGAKSNRRYRERWQMFVDHQFDPETDLARDASGLVRMLGKPALEDEIREYMRMRNEDSIDE